MKKYRYYVGADNGVTGSWSVIDTENGTSSFIETPVFEFRNYTKVEGYLKRVKWGELIANLPQGDAIVYLERPMIDPKRWTATQSALRALEATLIALEYIGLEYVFIDSKEWQKEFISSGIIGHDAMKEASKQIGIDLFPNHTTKIKKHKDADGILIAEYARRKHNG